jgi:hypothetical protein
VQNSELAISQNDWEISDVLPPCFLRTITPQHGVSLCHAVVKFRNYARCLVPAFDGAYFSDQQKEAL